MKKGIPPQIRDRRRARSAGIAPTLDDLSDLLFVVVHCGFGNAMSLPAAAIDHCFPVLTVSSDFCSP